MADPVTGPAAAGATAALSKKAGFAQNFDAFLMLLTTQLKNQSPLAIRSTPTNSRSSSCSSPPSSSS